MIIILSPPTQLAPCDACGGYRRIRQVCETCHATLCFACYADHERIAHAHD